MSSQQGFGTPSPTLPVSAPNTGLVASIWYQWFTRISQLSAERPFEPLTVLASPFVYTAYTIGNVIVQGGTVSSIVLTRDGVSVTCGEGVFIPVAANDTLTITYSVLPSITFIPSARA